jgi:sulfur-oxidizing protein SoxZ
MARPQPRVQAPGTAVKGDVFEVRTLIDHPMETGLRHDPSGKLIPRNIINSFACRYNGALVFSVDLHEGMAANPYLAFHVRATESGTLHYRWQDDSGAVFTLDSPLIVTA